MHAKFQALTTFCLDNAHTGRIKGAIHQTELYSSQNYLAICGLKQSNSYEGQLDATARDVIGLYHI